MSDEELVKHCMCGCMYLEAECPNCNKVTDANLIEALTQQLEAARADAKEAEAYAEELEREIELNEQEACMLENDFIEADKKIDDLKDKLAKAVELLKEARQDLEGYVTHEWPKDEHPVYERKWERDMELCRRIDATLAEIEGEKG
jgi:predicted  nucleic acid-binding Zn-ribbon protein